MRYYDMMSIDSKTKVVKTYHKGILDEQVQFGSNNCKYLFHQLGWQLTEQP